VGILSKRARAEPRAPAYIEDARRLALELAGLETPTYLDPMRAGLVLEPGEAARRAVGLWLRVQTGGQWSAPTSVTVIVTDRRLITRFDTEELVPLHWTGVVGLEPDVVRGHVVLDMGDGVRRAFSGPASPIVVVAAVAALYGTEALVTHPALVPLHNQVQPPLP
jgi:hypothetical protein